MLSSLLAGRRITIRPTFLSRAFIAIAIVSLNLWRTQEAKCAHFSQIAFEIGAQQKGYKSERQMTKKLSLRVEALKEKNRETRQHRNHGTPY
ncbi:hypothetical protein V6N13_093259 [Hibiscus sabdariffa]